MPRSVKQDSSRGLKNYLFAGGLSVAILAGMAGGWVYQYGSSMINEYDLNELSAKFDERVDELSPAQVVRLYETMNIGEGLGEWHEPPHVGATRQGKILQKFSYGLLGLSGLGLLTLFSSFLVRR